MGPPPGPPVSRPGVSDGVNKGILIALNILQQVLRMMDPSSEQADRLASVLRDLDELLARGNSSIMGTFGRPAPVPGNGLGPESANATHMKEAGDGARL